MPATIRINQASRRALEQIAEMTGESLQDALSRSIEDRRRRLYLEGLNSDYASLQGDPGAAKELEAELAEWDGTNLDGIEDEP